MKIPEHIGVIPDGNRRWAQKKGYTKEYHAFVQACIDAVKMISSEDALLRVIGNTESPMFPEELLPFTKRTSFGNGSIKVNFLVNYGWHWDLLNIFRAKNKNTLK